MSPKFIVTKHVVEIFQDYSVIKKILTDNFFSVRVLTVFIH